MESVPAPRATRRAFDLSRALHAGTWGVFGLLCGLILTAIIGHGEWSREQDDRQRSFDAAADAILFALNGKLQTSEFAVRSMQSLFLASDSVDAREFAIAFENLDARRQLPSLQAISYSEGVDLHGETHFITRTVMPATPVNLRLTGLDINTQPASLAAVLRSRDTDRVVMSAPFRLLQAPAGASDASGFVMRLPVYSPGPAPTDVQARRARMRGTLGASFMIESLIEGALRETTRAQMLVSVVDVTDGGETRLYHNDRLARPRDARRASRTLAFGDRVWRLDLVNGRPAAVLPTWLQVSLFGALSSLLFGLLVSSVAGTRGRAIALADAMTTRYRASESRFRQLNDLLPTLVLLFDNESATISYANQAARSLLGIPERGVALSELAPDWLMVALSKAAASGQMECEARLRSTSGDEFWASIVASKIELEGRSKWLMVASDVSEQKRLNERLSHEASHDPLTQLPNRQAFENSLRRMLISHADGISAVLFIDLDQFKLINDTSGHIAGDQLLIQLAMDMQKQLRAHDMVARLGGDEFGVLLPGVGSREEAWRVAERLREAIAGHAFLWDHRSYTTSASIGGAMISDDEPVSFKEVLAQVDTACYMAKDRGRNRVHFYSSVDDAAIRRRGEMDWVNRIRWALEESRLRLAFQELLPVGKAAQAPSTGVHIEVLLRMLDEEGQLIMPGAFLPAAERYGLMPRLDRWVINTALANFEHLDPRAPVSLCAINLSAASLEEDDFTDFVLQAFARHGVETQRVMFEITETVAVRDLGRVSRVIAALRESGCRIALDDFGAGMSSFGYLKNLEIDTIKIDGSFVRDIEHDAVSHSIVRAIADIGHQHGLNVVAEWVSSAAQVEVLAGLGVDYVQGFGIHEPELAAFQR